MLVNSILKFDKYINRKKIKFSKANSNRKKGILSHLKQSSSVPRLNEQKLTIDPKKSLDVHTGVFKLKDKVYSLKPISGKTVNEMSKVNR